MLAIKRKKYFRSKQISCQPVSVVMSSISYAISLEQGRKDVVVSECFYYSKLTRMICQGPNEQLASYPPGLPRLFLGAVAQTPRLIAVAQVEQGCATGTVGNERARGAQRLKPQRKAQTLRLGTVPGGRFFSFVRHRPGTPTAAVRPGPVSGHDPGAWHVSATTESICSH